MNYICRVCKKTYPIDTDQYKCECGGLFHIEYEKRIIDFEALLFSKEHSVSRYQEVLPFIDKEVTMKEGGTPIISLTPYLMGKGDYFMPTLSFKDRGAVVLVSMMKKLGIKKCAIDSSGNAATSVAAYCTRVGIECDVFVPSHTSDKKITQIEAHGATVHRIEGSREDTGKAVKDFIALNKVYYASHIYNPLFFEGTKTYVYELFEQYNYKLPEIIVVPVGNGTLLIGVSIALKELKEWGYITHYPQVVAVQSSNCAPIYHSWRKKSSHLEIISTSNTVAEGIASAEPPRGDELLEVIYSLNATVVSVSEDDIIEGQDFLAKRGLFVELTSSANYAGYKKFIEEYKEWENKSAVIPLCGAGLKSVH
ncbi:MAG: pyridoxal-phosphate dependent enzyme [Spirochaetia bacterium]|nr:pyridoxal-phosphate dependent enzyme [Spirochaetia bacterium]